jgi:hypothetical protein
MMQINYLYTFVLEFRGGTYLRQVTTDDVLTALLDWCTAIEECKLIENSERIACGFRDVYQCDDFVERPVSIDGLDFVWCASALIGDDSAMVHIVRGAPQ